MKSVSRGDVADLSFNSAHRGVTIRGAWRSEIRGRGRSPDPTSRFTAGASEMRGRGRSTGNSLSIKVGDSLKSANSASRAVMMEGATRVPPPANATNFFRVFAGPVLRSDIVSRRGVSERHASQRTQT